MPNLAALPLNAIALRPKATLDAQLEINGSVMVTGGLGGIGQTAGHWVAGATLNTHVWLLGRAGRSKQSIAASWIPCHGCISMTMGSVAIYSDVAAITDQINAISAPALTSVLHAAAVLHDALLPRQTALGLRSVFAPKVSGALALLNALSVMPLQNIVQFGSLSALLGTKGQANYAAANCTLEEISQQCLDFGLLSSTVLWGPWASGMALENPEALSRFERAGLGLVDGRTINCAPVFHMQHTDLCEFT